MPVHPYPRPRWFVALLVILLVGPPAAVPLHAQALPPCSPNPTFQTHIRALEAWYGSAFDGATAVVDALELTDHITEVLELQITLDPNVDSRVKAHIGAWANSTDDMAWVLAPSEHLLAEANLRAALAAALDDPVFDAPIDQGTQDYFLTVWTTIEPCTGGGTLIVEHDGFARVRYVELNAEENTGDTCAGLPATQGCTVNGVVGPCIGTDANDRINGTSGDDVILGLGGHDRIEGKGGNDVICGGPGNDDLFGNAGHDRIFGEEGNDSVSGGNGNDELDGGPDTDRLRGDAGTDTCTGGEDVRGCP